ncbi:MAG: hypothetical protein R8J84_00290 [Mariprofundales bacterium]
MIATAVVTGGLLHQGERWHLHPALDAWQPALLRRRQHWFTTACHNPLSALGALCSVPAAKLMVNQTIGEAGERGCGQWWVVSPWHGQAAGTKVRLMPASMLRWQQRDAQWLQQLIQPLLEPLGMELRVLSAGAMVMHCRQAMDVAPAPFPQLEQEGLGNRHPAGADGGALMRLLSEIQMLLHQQPADDRHGLPAIHGVWLWGGWDQDAGQDLAALNLPAVACVDPLLRAITDGRDSALMVAGAEEMDGLIDTAGAVPSSVVLTGDGHALWLSGWRWWWPKAVLRQSNGTEREEDELWPVVAEAHQRLSGHALRCR